MDDTKELQKNRLQASPFCADVGRFDRSPLAAPIELHTNQDLCRRVNIYLNSRHIDAFRRLDVEVEDGSVVLSGKLDSYYQKQVALNTCQRVAGVVALVDNITVDQNKRK